MSKIRFIDFFSGIGTGHDAIKEVFPSAKCVAMFEKDKSLNEFLRAKYRYDNVFTDVFQWEKFLDEQKRKDIDLIIGGPPCQNLTVLGNRDGLNGKKSKAFFPFADAIKKIKPKYFLVENVGTMKDCERDKISDALGVQPVMINSNLFSLQNRQRYYWCSFPIKINGGEYTDWQKKDDERRLFGFKYHTHTFSNFSSSYRNKKGAKEKIIEKRYTRSNYANTLLTGEHCKSFSSQVFLEKIGYNERTPLTIEQCLALQTIKSQQFFDLTEKQIFSAIGNAMTYRVIVNILRSIKK